MRSNNVSLLVSALPAAIFYGALAAASNSSHGFRVAGQAAVLQAMISYVSTLVALTAMFKLADLLSDCSAAVRRSIVPLCVVSLFSTVSLIIHWRAGTPNVWLTVAPSFVIGWAYFTTVYWLKDTHRSIRRAVDHV